MNEIDIQILKYINKHGEIHIDEILKKFPDDKYSTEYRISELSQVEYRNNLRLPIPNSSYILSKYEHNKDKHGITHSKKLNIYYLTELGKTVIQDLKAEEEKKKKEKIETWLLESMRSFFFPLIVALITAYITAYITAKYFK